MKWLVRLAAVAAIFASLSGARAEEFPSRPITIIVPFAAGGPTDTIARIIGERMRVSLGQPILIENVTGASGSIAGARVARAAPTATRSPSDIGAHMLSTPRSTRCTTTLSDFEPIGLSRPVRS